MANLDGPKGFWPIRHLAGGCPQRNSEYSIASGYNVSIFSGDAVKLVAGGTIERAAVGDRLIGIFEGVQYTAADGSPVFSKVWTAATVSADAKAKVYDDPLTVFGVQADGNTVAADVGQLADIVATAGDTATGDSREELDTSDQAATTGQLRILGKIDDPENDWGTNVNLEVQIWEHEFIGHDQGTPGV